MLGYDRTHNWPSDRLADGSVVHDGRLRRGQAAEGARQLAAQREHLRHRLYAPHYEYVLQHRAQRRALHGRLGSRWWLLSYENIFNL